MHAEFVERAREIIARYPKPWHIADNGMRGEGTTYAWICDAAGGEVVGSSEWLKMDYDLMQLVVDIFNSVHIPSGD